MPPFIGIVVAQCCSMSTCITLLHNLSNLGNLGRYIHAYTERPASADGGCTVQVESLVQEAEEAAGADNDAVLGGAAALASRPAQEQPRAKHTKCAFAGDVGMPQAVNESYEKWAQWRDHVAATFCAFLNDDLAAKKAGEYCVEVMHRGLDQAGVDVATAWAAPLAEPHEALLMMALYENHARWGRGWSLESGAIATPWPRPPLRAQRGSLKRSATIWASGHTRDPYFVVLWAPRGIMVTPSGGFDF